MGVGDLSVQEMQAIKEAFELFFANSVDANDNADVDDVEADE